MHQQARNDTRMGLIVEQGIAHDFSHGSVAAWRFMAAHGVPEQLILRVLAHPSQRRASDARGPHLHHHDGAPRIAPLPEAQPSTL